MIYRIRQGLANLGARMLPEDWVLADRYLSEAERALFARMEPADQRHSTQVLRTLLQAAVTDESLLKAALLHDVGKSRCRITLVHRTVAVLFEALLGRLPALEARGDGKSWWLPFYVLANHPRIGASMLAQAGTEERVWRLVELHQLEPQRVSNVPDAHWIRAALATLRRADNQN